MFADRPHSTVPHPAVRRSGVAQRALLGLALLLLVTGPGHPAAAAPTRMRPAAPNAQLAGAPDAPPAAPESPAMPRLIDGRAIRAEIADGGLARVIVLLRDPAPRMASDAVRLPAVAAAQAAVLAALPAGSSRLVRRYELLAALALEVEGQGLAVLAAHPGVASIEPDRKHETMSRERAPSTLAEQRPLIGVDQVWQRYGLSGEGVRVAIIDTGIDEDHPDLADDLIDQRCFSSQGGCGQNNATEGPVANDEDGHGTSMAGIVSSGGKVAPRGIAPDAEIVAIRVFDDRSGARTADIIAGFDWLERNRQRLKVKVVNMSLGSGTPFVGNCDNQDSARAEAVKRLVQRGVAVFAASGNQGSDNGMSAPACIRDVISVAASYDVEGGRQPPRGEFGGSGCFDESSSPLMITCFSSINRQLDIVAPGAWTTVPRNGGGTSQTAGTSNASPVAAAVAALLLQADDGLRNAEIRRILSTTGIDARKADVNQDHPRINALAAVESLGLPTPTPDGPPPTATSAPSDTPAPTPTAAPSATATATAPATGVPPTAVASATPAVSATDTPAPADTAEPTATGQPRATIYLPINRHD